MQSRYICSMYSSIFSSVVILLADLDLRLTLALLVLQVAVEQQNARVLNVSAHFRMHHVLDQQNAVQHARILARYLLDSSVLLNVDLFATVLVDEHRAH